MLILEPNLHPPPEMSSNNLMGHITDLADATKGWLPFRRAVRGCHCGSGTSVPRPRACRESSEISWNGPRDSHSRIPSAIATPVVFQNPSFPVCGSAGKLAIQLHFDGGHGSGRSTLSRVPYCPFWSSESNWRWSPESLLGIGRKTLAFRRRLEYACGFEYYCKSSHTVYGPAHIFETMS